MAESNFIIYGANGYTGRLIVQEAIDQGLRPTISGRNQEQLEQMGKESGLEVKVFDLEAPSLAEEIKDFDIVLHCAGPFYKTALPMMKACLQTNTHYLDITGEIEVFEVAAAMDERAKDVGIVLMPGVGFDVVPSDCLAGHLAHLLSDATHLELAFKGGGGISQGTALTMMENMHKGGAIRENGKIRKVPAAYESKLIQFSSKAYKCTTIPWGDVSTAFYSTGIPNIKVYTATKPDAVKFMKMTNKLGWLLKLNFVQNILRKRIKSKVKGPSEEIRHSAKSELWGKVTNGSTSVEVHLNTAEGYKLTAMTAIGSVKKMQAQRVFAGFKTPSMAFGPDFIMEFEGTTREEVVSK